MTVAELIEHLSTLNPDADVYTLDEYGYTVATGTTEPFHEPGSVLII